MQLITEPIALIFVAVIVSVCAFIVFMFYETRDEQL